MKNKALDEYILMTVLSHFSTPALTSAPPPFKMNLFISPHHQKPILYYKIPQFNVKCNIFCTWRLTIYSCKTLRKAPEKHCNQNLVNFYFDIISNFQNPWGANKG